MKQHKTVRVTVDLDDKLIEEAMELWEFEGRKTKRALVDTALRELLDAIHHRTWSGRFDAAPDPRDIEETV